MSLTTERILRELAAVQRLRAAQAADASRRRRVAAIKSYQSRRFERAYADLLAHPRYRAAARFFLDELYGPIEFDERDAQFARVVPGVVRIFPGDLAGTLERLAQLHALSERLDDAMAQRLNGDAAVDAAAYVRAWQATGEPDSRRRQIVLTLAVGAALERYTRGRLLRATLHMMRAPARAAGLGSLQRFLEVGFDAFARMNGATEFLATIDEREYALADALESAQARAWALGCRDGSRWPRGGPLDQLP